MSNYNNMSLSEIEAIAKHFYGSGMFPDIKSASMAVVKIMLGRDLGLSPMEAISGVQVQNGKPTLGATLQAMLVKRSGRYDYRVVHQSDDLCEIEWRQGGEVVGVSTYTMSEAKAAGLTSKEVWRKYPSDMLFARALTRGIRRYAADALSGVVYTPEEIEDVQPVVLPPPRPERALEARQMVHESRQLMEAGKPPLPVEPTPEEVEADITTARLLGSALAGEEEAYVPVSACLADIIGRPAKNPQNVFAALKKCSAAQRADLITRLASDAHVAVATELSTMPEDAAGAMLTGVLSDLSLSPDTYTSEAPAAVRAQVYDAVMRIMRDVNRQPE